MDTGSDGHRDPPCTFLGGPSAASDLRVCGLEDGRRESQRDDLAASTWSREHRAVLATDHLFYFYDSYHHGIGKPGSSRLKTEAGGGGSVPFLTPDHLEIRSPGNKEPRAGCLSDPMA